MQAEPQKRAAREFPASAAFDRIAYSGILVFIVQSGAFYSIGYGVIRGNAFVKPIAQSFGIFFF